LIYTAKFVKKKTCIYIPTAQDN